MRFSYTPIGVNYMLLFFLCICAFGFIYAVILYWRNQRVFSYRQKLLDKIAIVVAEDFEKRNFNYQWRYDAFQAVPYVKMVNRFWKPLKSFYPDMKFTEPS